jgi:multidrug efflux pump subunit AcrA (membrane-fusion protein)
MRTLTFTAPASGTVTTKRITEGEKFSPGQTLFHITGLNPLWLMVDVYEQDLSWIDVGSRAEVELPYDSGQTVTGRVDYIYDEVDDDTRTVRARVSVPNPNRARGRALPAGAGAHGAFVRRAHAGATRIGRGRAGGDERTVPDRFGGAAEWGAGGDGG